MFCLSSTLSDSIKHSSTLYGRKSAINKNNWMILWIQFYTVLCHTCDLYVCWNEKSWIKSFQEWWFKKRLYYEGVAWLISGKIWSKWMDENDEKEKLS